MPLENMLEFAALQIPHSRRVVAKAPSAHNAPIYKYLSPTTAPTHKYLSPHPVRLDPVSVPSRQFFSARVRPFCRPHPLPQSPLPAAPVAASAERAPPRETASGQSPLPPQRAVLLTVRRCCVHSPTPDRFTLTASETKERVTEAMVPRDLTPLGVVRLAPRSPQSPPGSISFSG